MAKNKEMSARQEAGLVEDDFEQKPRDEVVEAGEHLSEESEDMGEVILSQPSGVASPYMPAEDQMLELKTDVVGPPAYGSPEPATSAGKLLPLNEHPLRAESLPEGHPAAISDDYGADHEGATVMPGESSQPVTMLDLNTQSEADEASEGGYEEMTKAELVDLADERGVEVSASWKKDEIIEALEAADQGGDQGEGTE